MLELPNFEFSNFFDKQSQIRTSLFQDIDRLKEMFDPAPDIRTRLSLDFAHFRDLLTIHLPAAAEDEGKIPLAPALKQDL